MTGPRVPTVEIDRDALARAVDAIVATALAEDLGEDGDVTTRATVAPDRAGRAAFVARRAGVVCGTAAAAAVYAAADPAVAVTFHVRDGDRVDAGDELGTVAGPLGSILTGERTALNLLGHLSGIATRTAAFVDVIAGTGAVVRDTRKTTPGMRLLEKHAVRCGGGVNHRAGLHDALLVKDNHVAAAGSIHAAVTAALTHAGGRHVQVEVDTLDQLDEALTAGATDVLLDNFTPDEARQAVERVAGRAALEASGTITLETARAYAEAGVDRLAVGSVTHSAPWLDIGLDIRLTDPGRD